MTPYPCYAYECDCDGFLRGRIPSQCAICLHPQAAHPSVNAPRKAQLYQHTKPDNEVESVDLTADTEPSAASDSSSDTETEKPEKRKPAMTTPAATSTLSHLAEVRDHRRKTAYKEKAKKTKTKNIGLVPPSKKSVLGKEKTHVQSLIASLVLFTKRPNEKHKKEALIYKWHISDLVEEVESYEDYLRGIIQDEHPGWRERGFQEEWCWGVNDQRKISMGELTGTSEKLPPTKLITGNGTLLSLIKKIEDIPDVSGVTAERKKLAKTPVRRFPIVVPFMSTAIRDYTPSPQSSPPLPPRRQPSKTQCVEKSWKEIQKVNKPLEERELELETMMDMTRVKKEKIKVRHLTLRVRVRRKQTETVNPERNI